MWWPYCVQHFGLHLLGPLQKQSDPTEHWVDARSIESALHTGHHTVSNQSHRLQSGISINRSIVNKYIYNFLDRKKLANVPHATHTDYCPQIQPVTWHSSIWPKLPDSLTTFSISRPIYGRSMQYWASTMLQPLRRPNICINHVRNCWFDVDFSIEFNRVQICSKHPWPTMEVVVLLGNLSKYQ